MQIADVNNISMNMVISTDGKSTHSILASIYLLKCNEMLTPINVM